MAGAADTIDRVLPFVSSLGRMARFFFDALAAALTPKFYWKTLLEQMERMCIHCTMPILFVLAPMGAVIALESVKVFSMFGATNMTSSLLSVAMFREIAPVMGGIMVASQTGAEIAAEIAGMRVRGLIDALEVMSVNPRKAVIAPRMLAGLLITPILTLVGTFTGIAGGYIIAVIVKGGNAGAFLHNLFAWVTMTDVVGGLIKAAVFGLMVIAISCYHGYHAGRGAAGVGQATNDSVVASVVSILVMNYFLTTAFFGFDI